MAEKDKTEAEEPRVFDVAKPGTSTPNTGSKPMVVGHKSIAIDPSMRSAVDQANVTVESNDPVPTEPVPTISSAAKKIITPPSENESDDKTEAVDSTEKAHEVQSGTQEEKKSPAVNPKKTENENKDEEIKDESTADSNSEELEEDSKSEEIQELIKSKEFFVNIESAESSRFKKLLLVILSLFLLLIGAYVLADVELIPGADLLPKRFLEPSSISESVSSEPPSSSEAKKPDVEEPLVDSFTAPDGFGEFKSSALGFSIWIPPTMQVFDNGVGDGSVPPEELKYINFGVIDKETSCCNFIAEDVYNNENQRKELGSLFESGGLEAIAKESNRVNKEDKNENVPDKTVSDVVVNKRGNVTTYEYTVTGSLSTGYFDDTQSGALVTEKTVVIFFETDKGIVRVYGQLNDESEIILNTLRI